MTKENTVGSIGENLFIDFLIKNGIDYIDLRNNIIHKTIKVNKTINQPEYLYLSNSHSHPFDFIVNNKNIEIKTSTIHKFNNRINFSWYHNDISNIDYVVGIVITNSNKIKDFFLFDNKYITSHKAFAATYNSKFLPIIDKKTLFELLSH